MATVIVAIIVFGLVGLITGKGIYDKKHHKSGCGCDCSSCGGGCPFTEIISCFEMA